MGEIKMDHNLPPAGARGEPGTAESAAYFNAALAELGETKATFARLLQRKGDNRLPATILRNVQRMASGEARISGEMRVILYMMTRAKRRAERAGGAIRPPKTDNTEM